MKRLIPIVMALAVISGCAKPKDLVFVDIQNIRLVNLGLTESEIGFDARFFNPNSKASLKDAEAKLYVNSTFLGDTKLDSLISVPRNDTFAVPLVLNIKSMAAVSQLVQTLSDSTVDVKVEGVVKVGKAGVFRSFPISYTRVQSVRELMQQIR